MSLAPGTRLFPAGAGKFQVSSGGGTGPRWRADGRELYFRSNAGLMAVKIQTSPRFAAGTLEELFEVRTVRSGTTRDYDASPDGSRFLVTGLATGERVQPSATVIVNWQAGWKTAGGR